MTDKEQLESLARDVATMKSSLKKNQGLIREMMAGSGLSFLSVSVGLATTGFALISHFLSREFGGFRAIPAPLRVGLLVFIALVCVSGVFMKFSFIDRRSKEIRSGYSLGQFVRLFYSRSMIHSTVASVAIMVVSSVLAAAAGHPWLAVPFVTALVVVPVNAVADVTGLTEYYVTGYASLAGGIASYFLIDSAPFLALALASSAVYFSFAISTAVAWKRRGSR